MKKIYTILTEPIVKVFSNILTRVNLNTNLFKERFPDGVINRLNNIAMQESAEYFKEFEHKIMLFHKREDLWDYSLQKIKKDGVFLEFGVWYGRSINYMARKLKNRKL